MTTTTVRSSFGQISVYSDRIGRSGLPYRAFLGFVWTPISGGFIKNGCFLASPEHPAEDEVYFRTEAAAVEHVARSQSPACHNDPAYHSVSLVRAVSGDGYSVEPAVIG